MLTTELTGDLSPFELCVLDVERAFSDPSVPFHVFWEQIYSVLTPCVAFIPHKFKCEPAAANTNALFRELLTVEVRHHGYTLAQTWNIRVNIANAVRRVFKASSVASEGYYGNFMKDPFQAGKWLGELHEWSIGSALVQFYVWELNVPRLEPGMYPVQVKEIDVLPGTQFTTTVGGALTPSEQLEIKE